VVRRDEATSPHTCLFEPDRGIARRVVAVTCAAAGSKLSPVRRLPHSGRHSEFLERCFEYPLHCDWRRGPLATRYWILAAALYALAKVFEFSDSAIFSAGYLLSGHTLKHLAAAAACFAILRCFQTRRLLT
jgi:hypothetical protein